MSTAMPTKDSSPLWEEDPLYKALAMIDLRPWAVRAQIVIEVRRLCLDSPDGWARIGFREMALRVHRSERYCYDLMGPTKGVMWRVERVLVRGEVGKGTRGTAYRVNPNPADWRGVPWVHDRQVRRLTFGPLRRAPHRDSSHGVASRSLGATLEPQNPPENGENGALESRSLVATLGISSVATKDRDTRVDDQPPPHLSLLNLTSTSEEEEEKAAQRGHVKSQVVAAVFAKTQALVFGEPLGRIVQMGCDNLPAVLAAVAAAPRGYGPKLVVDFVEARLASTPARAPLAPQLARRAQILRTLIGADPDGDRAEDQRRELEACENELARFEAQEA